MVRHGGAGRLVPASAVWPGRVEWLWPGWIPFGGISLLAGDPGIGKSLLTARLAARLSVGELGGRLARSLILTAEDSVGAVVVPRLQEAGADKEQVFVPGMDGDDHPLWLPEGAATLTQWVVEYELTLVVIDPLTAYLPDRKVDTWRDSSVRGALAPLARLADRHRVAVLAVVHLNKAQGSDPIRRLGGSIGLPAAARSVLLLAADPDHPGGGRRVLAHAKNNLGVHAQSLSLEIRNGADANRQPHIVELGSSRYTARDLLAEPESPDKLAEAVDFLSTELAGGPRPAPELHASAAAVGITEITLRRAKHQLGVESTKVGFDHWAWKLPNSSAGGGDHVVAA